MVLEHGSTLELDGLCVGHAFMSIYYVFSHPCCMWLLPLHCVGHGGSGVAMEVLMMLFSTCYHECMTECVLFLFMLSHILVMLVCCPCMVAYVM